MPKTIRDQRTMWGRSSTPDYGRAVEEPDAEKDTSEGFYLNLQGIADDGTWADVAGTYTGSANALIENPADMLHHILRNYCNGVAAADIVTSGFGSFATARTALNARVTGDFRIRARDGLVTTASKAIEAICKECGLWLIQPYIDTKWRLVAWNASPSGDDYMFRPAASGGTVEFSWDRHIQPQSSEDDREPEFHWYYTPLDEIYNQVYVNYDYDHPTQKYKRQCYVDELDSNPTSSAGETACVDSQAAYGVKRRATVNCDFLWGEVTAEWLRDFTIARRAAPKLCVEFVADMNASDLVLGQVFQMSSDIDVHFPYPVLSSNGSWSGKKFWCQRSTRMQNEQDRILYRIVGLQV